MCSEIAAARVAPSCSTSARSASPLCFRRLVLVLELSWPSLMYKSQLQCQQEPTVVESWSLSRGCQRARLNEPAGGDGHWSKMWPS